MQENSKQNHKFGVEGKTRVMRWRATGNKMPVCMDVVKTLTRISRREEEIIRGLYLAFWIDWMEGKKDVRYWVGQRRDGYKITKRIVSVPQCNVEKTLIIKL